MNNWFRPSHSLDRADIAMKVATQLLVGAGVILLVFFGAYFLDDRTNVGDSWWDYLQVASIALLPAFFLALVDRQSTVNEVGSAVRNNLAESLDMVMRGRERYGLHSIHETLDVSALFKSLNRGDELLWLSTWRPDHDSFSADMEKAIRRGVKIRMLIIEPTCKNAEYRSEEIEHDLMDKKHFMERAEVFKNHMERITESADSSGRKCIIRMYSDLPGSPMYIVCHNGKAIRAFSSLFLAKPSGLYWHFEWTKTDANESVLNDLKNHFDRKWEKQADRGETVCPSTSIDATQVTVNG